MTDSKALIERLRGMNQLRITPMVIATVIEAGEWVQ